MELEIIEKDRYRKKNISFTNGQKVAADKIINFIATPFNPAKYIIGLIGSGGTGKTFLTKYIIDHCKYSSSVIECCSPTHKACRVFSQAIGGKTVHTIQSVLGLRIDLKLEDFDPLNPQFSPTASPKLENTKILIIDEASMIPAKLFNYICNECKKRHIKIILIGDDFQLAPVNEKKSSAFTKCFATYRLTEIVRQKANNPITNLLSLLRYDIEHGTYRFIEYVSKHVGVTNYNEFGEGFNICGFNKFKDLINNSFGSEEYSHNIDSYRIIAYTNSTVSGWNSYIRNNIIPDSERNIITKHDLIMSYETIVDEFTKVVINNSEEYVINEIVDFVDDKYKFKGFLVKFRLVHGTTVTSPLFIIDHRDKYSILQYHKVITNIINSAKVANRAERVSRWKDYYAFKRKYLIAANIVDRNGKTLYTRDIDYGFAITSHRAQGSTYNTVFIDMDDMIYDKNRKPYPDYNDMLRRLYVACSRASSELIIRYGI